MPYISPTTPPNTQPPYHSTEEPPTPTDFIQSVKQPNAKRKQTDPPDSEEVAINIKATPHPDIIMEEQDIPNPPDTKNISKTFNTLNTRQQEEN